MSMETPQPIEQWGQQSGFVVYSTVFMTPGNQTVMIDALHDYANIYLNGTYYISLDRA